MRHRWRAVRRLALFGGVVAAAVAACRPIPAPTDGVLSLSSVVLPSPAVVAGDTMRDSLGRAAPLRVYAFGVGGESDTITNLVPTFVVFDRGAHVTPDGYLVGDSARDTPVRVIGSVGVLQTSQTNVFVTLMPGGIAPTGTTTTDTVRFDGADTAASVNFSRALGVQVTAAGAPIVTGIAGVIVRFSIAYAPTPTGTGASGLLVDIAGHPAWADTTDGSGNASLRIRVRPAAPAARADSFVVMATASYRGAALVGAPVRFVVPIRSVLASGSRAH